MAIYMEPIEKRKLTARGVMLDVSAADDGQWFSFEGMTKATVHVVITGTATVNVCGSNEDAPANTAHGINLLGEHITETSMVYINGPLRWIKVRVLALTGTAKAYVQAH